MTRCRRGNTRMSGSCPGTWTGVSAPTPCTRVHSWRPIRCRNPHWRSSPRALLVLDQVLPIRTMSCASAFGCCIGAGGLVMTRRHSPPSMAKGGLGCSEAGARRAGAEFGAGDRGIERPRLHRHGARWRRAHPVRGRGLAGACGACAGRGGRPVPYPRKLPPTRAHRHRRALRQPQRLRPRRSPCTRWPPRGSD